MVLQTERYNGGYQQQSYSAYHGSDGGYNSYQSVADYSTPYPGSFQVLYPLNTSSSLHQSGWSSDGDCYGNGANHRLGGGMGVPVKPTSGGYESSYYESLYTHGNTNNHGNSLHQIYGSLHGSDHQSYGSPHGQVQGGSHHQGHESPHDYDHGGSHHQRLDISHGQGYRSQREFGKTHGVGGAVKHQINKLTHSYGNSSPNYGHNPSGFNYGYTKPSWTVKGLKDDDDDE